MSWTDSQIETIVDQHFRGKDARCPQCGAQVKVHPIDMVGRRTSDLLLSCRRCGEHGQYSGEHMDALDLSWTVEQMRTIVDDYWGRGIVRCPNDGARLSVHESRVIGPGPTQLMILCKRCGRHFDSRHIPETPDPVSFEGRFEVVRALGRGGMGEVQLVRDRKTGREFAAKKITPEFVRNPEIVRRFQREVRLICGLHHRHVVPVHDVFLDEGGGILVMDYMPQGTLAAAINAPEVGPRALAEMFRGVVIGLKHVHEQGIIHRDLKPSNVLIDETGIARISDFGLAVLIERDTTPLTQYKQGLGTPAYAAPEQVHDAGSVGREVDIYALGLIAYEIATRRSPYLQPVRHLRGKLGEAIARALEEDPRKRNVTGDELADALELAATEGQE